MVEFTFDTNRSVQFERSQIIGKPETSLLKISFIDRLNERQEILFCYLDSNDIEQLIEYLTTPLII